MNLFALPFLVLSITLAATPFADATISTIFNNCCQIRSRSVGFVSSQRKKYTNRKRESFDGNDFNLLCPHQNDGEKSAHKNMYQFQVGFRRRQLNLEMSSSNEGMLQENFDSNNSLEENAHFDRELRFSGVGRYVL